jgi:hypothetical protein
VDALHLALGRHIFDTPSFDSLIMLSDKGIRIFLESRLCEVGLDLDPLDAEIPPALNCQSAECLDALNGH